MACDADNGSLLLRFADGHHRAVGLLPAGVPPPFDCAATGVAWDVVLEHG